MCVRENSSEKILLAKDFSFSSLVKCKWKKYPFFLYLFNIYSTLRLPASALLQRQTLNCQSENDCKSDKNSFTLFVLSYFFFYLYPRLILSFIIFVLRIHRNWHVSISGGIHKATEWECSLRRQPTKRKE